MKPDITFCSDKTNFSLHDTLKLRISCALLEKPWDRLGLRARVHIVSFLVVIWTLQLCYHTHTYTYTYTYRDSVSTSHRTESVSIISQPELTLKIIKKHKRIAQAKCTVYRGLIIKNIQMGWVGEIYSIWRIQHVEHIFITGLQTANLCVTQRRCGLLPSDKTPN
jgi:hypothetical protein